MVADKRVAPRWVLDTNVFLSALIRPSGIAGCLRLVWQNGLFVPLLSRTLTPLRRLAIITPARAIDRLSK